ncbi:hypothetical protein RRG08_041842 [Elysia crispata]|uniref:Uncharacterized protein n=1 Tax=Elysia crispata TaxID=231223 RepID=A0AAE1CQD9_9GAST|nr:hypothetical protein RRG08_041842 [Elysia crispata]
MPALTFIWPLASGENTFGIVITLSRVKASQASCYWGFSLWGTLEKVNEPITKESIKRGSEIWHRVSSIGSVCFMHVQRLSKALCFASGLANRPSSTCPRMVSESLDLLGRYETEQSVRPKNPLGISSSGL